MNASGSKKKQARTRPDMQVDIVDFPETRVAVIEHRGGAMLEHQTVRKLVAFKLEQGLTDPDLYRHFGLHYLDDPDGRDSRVDFCLSIDALAGELPENKEGIREGRIQASRCAHARDVGSRNDNRAARFLFDTWLPSGDEQPSGLPMIFHYVNVGPGVQPADMITDVYLPLA